MITIDINKNNSIELAAAVLRQQGVLIFPTDTVYGIGTILSKVAIRKLYKIKNRPSSQPTAVLMNRNIFDSKRIKELVLEPKLDDQFYSGELTIIDDCKNYTIDFPKMIMSEDLKIGVRLPQHEWIIELIDKVGPIAASSANKKGEVTPVNFVGVGEQIKNEADLVIESNEKMSGKSSEIYVLDLNKKIR